MNGFSSVYFCINWHDAICVVFVGYTVKLLILRIFYYRPLTPVNAFAFFRKRYSIILPNVWDIFLPQISKVGQPLSKSNPLLSFL